MGREGTGGTGRRAGLGKTVRLAEERDRLIRRGLHAAAWKLVADSIPRLRADAETDVFLSDSVVLSMLGHKAERAGDWVAAYRERARATGTLDSRRVELLRALDFGEQLARKDYAAARRTETSLDWHAIADVPWAVNLRLFSVMIRGSRAAALDVLRESRAHFQRPFDLGNRLRILAHFEMYVGDVERFLRLYRAACRHFRKGEGLQSRLGLIDLRGQLGRLYLNNGQYAEACRELEALREGTEGCHREFFESTYVIELALAYSGLGQHERGRNLLSSVVAGRPRNRAHAAVQIRAHQVLAETAVDETRLGEARDNMRSAQALLDRSPDSGFQAYLHTTRARVEAAEGSAAACARALSYLDQAEAVFRTLGSRGLHGLSKTLTVRGHVNLRRRDVPGAIDCCLRSMELARKHRFLPLQARALLLKSYLLVEADMPAADKTYEEVLRDLGLVHNPVLLFKVVANLYIYSWKLDDGLELTDHHLQQLARLRDVLEGGLYADLYRKYVTRRVIERWVRSMEARVRPRPLE